MATAAELAPTRRSARGVGRGTGAFGLEVVASYDVPGLVDFGAGVPKRRADCRRQDARELAREWPEAEAETLLERRYPDGRLFLRVSRHPQRGICVCAPRYGRHVISADGARIMSAEPRRPGLGWQRLFFAQTLPLAASLQGLEVLHASAVGSAGRAIAFTAASGTGKSSLLAHAVVLGADFITDDVLAVELADGGVVAHAGPRRANVQSAELRSLPRERRDRLGSRLGASDKLLLEPPSAGVALPLAILYRVRRSRDVPELRFTEQVPPQPRQVLASSFLPYLRTKERLLNQLAICDGIARSVRTFALDIPPTASAREAAEAALAHAEGTRSG